MTDTYRHSVQVGNIRYLDGSSLQRPTKMPKTAITFGAVLFAIALVIGIFMFSQFYTKVILADEQATAEMTANLTRPIDMKFPSALSLLTMNNEEIESAVAATGCAYVNTTSEQNAAKGGLELFVMPSDVTQEQCTVWMEKGINSLDPQDAAKILNGGYKLTVSREGPTDIRFHFADFKSSNINNAVSSALTTFGVDSSTLGEAGKDDNGNTFQEGSQEGEGVTAAWRVSAIELKEVYDIPGFPKDAYYLGVRFSA